MMVVAAAAAVAVPLAEKVSQSKSEKVAKSKAVHYIENRPETNGKALEEIKEVELPLLGQEKLPTSEPQPLELKGVRG
ncbi:MAG: hypothetical protein ABII81_01145 [Pseudomonadota bacterium]